ncbi:hypothetical protein CRUP_035536 [Coryphaenoides rupestris]|nr:hypothetical protein CRUP_035536 [Coryphaenoides rupestris]
MNNHRTKTSGSVETYQEDKDEVLHTDLDVGGKRIKYVLAGEGAGTIFAINEMTGDIHAMKRLDREEKAEYTLTAQVTNADTDEPLEPPSEFIIKVQDINDNPPQFVEGPYRASVPEMSTVALQVRRFLLPFGVIPRSPALIPVPPSVPARQPTVE